MDDLNKALEYGADAIKEALGAEKHRLNVSQYLGSDDAVGIENQMFEILDNSIDECLEYRQLLLDAIEEQYHTNYPSAQGTKINLPPVTIKVEITHTDDVIIEDMGRGLPILPQEATGEPTIFRIYESDSAGGKGNLAQGGYKTMTAGMHGAGAAVSKSCTDRFEITTKTLGADGKGMGVYAVTYIDGERDKSQGVDGLVTISTTLDPSPIPEYRSMNLYDTGTRIKYHFAESVFKKTRNGVPCEAYNNESILERIRYILLAVEDADALIINYKYKDEPVVNITPKDFTPELFLGATSPESVFSFYMTSSKGVEDEGYFNAKVYVNYNPMQISFQSKTVVNRLSLDTADSNEIIQQLIKNLYKDSITYEIKQEQDTPAIRNSISTAARGIALDMFSHHNVLVIMQLAKAKFDGQTKKNLKSKEYISEFTTLARSGIRFTGRDYFGKFIEAGKSQLESQVKGILAVEKQRQKDLKKAQAYVSVTNAIKDARSVAIDPLKRLEQYMNIYDDKNNSMLTLKQSIHDVKDSWLILVEGASAAGALGQVDDLPITVVGLQGKPSNTTNMVSIDKQQIKDLLTQFAMNYKAIGIMTDADSDGMHIRILLLAAIMRFIPQYIDGGRVFIINSPNARLQNISNEEIVVQVFNRTYRYLPGSQILTKTPTETELLLKNYKDKVVLYEKYGGLADSTTDGATNLSLINLLEDPDYRSVIASPTDQEKNILYDILSKDSQLKKAIANEICTDRMKYIKNVSNVNSRLKLRSLDLFSQTFDQVPTILHHEQYTYENIGYQDVNEVY